MNRKLVRALAQEPKEEASPKPDRLVLLIDRRELAHLVKHNKTGHITARIDLNHSMKLDVVVEFFDPNRHPTGGLDYTKMMQDETMRTLFLSTM